VKRDVAYVRRVEKKFDTFEVADGRALKEKHGRERSFVKLSR
jgi:hypothetical protein